MFLRLILKFYFQIHNGLLPVYFNSFKFIKNSDVHSFNTRRKNDPHISHEFNKAFTRLCLKYSIFKLDQFTTECNISHSLANNYLMNFNCDRLNKLFYSKPNSMFLSIISKVNTHSLNGYLKYIKVRFIDMYI